MSKEESGKASGRRPSKTKESKTQAGEIPQETTMAEPKMNDNGNVTTQVAPVVSVVPSPPKGPVQSGVSEALVAKLLQNPELGDVINVVMSGGKLTPEKASKLMGTLGFDVGADQLKTTEPVVVEEVAPTEKVKPKISLVEALNRTLPRLQAAVRDHLPDEMALMIVIGHSKGVQINPMLNTGNGEVVVSDEIGGQYRAKLAGEAIEKILIEVGVRSGRIVIKEEGDDDDDDLVDDEDDDDGEE